MKVALNSVKALFIGAVLVLVSLIFWGFGLVAVSRDAYIFSVPLVFTLTMVVAEEFSRFLSSRLLRASPRWRWYVAAIPIKVLESLPGPAWSEFMEIYGEEGKLLLLGILHKAIALSGHVVGCLLWGYVARDRLRWLAAVALVTIFFHSMNNGLVFNHFSINNSDLTAVLHILTGLTYIVVAFVIVRLKDRSRPDEVNPRPCP